MKTQLKDPIPEILPLLPLRNRIIFPLMAAPLYIGRLKSISAVELAHKEGGYIILALQKDENKEDPQINDLYTTGILANIIQLFRLRNGTFKTLVSGMQRVKFAKVVSEDPCFKVEYEILNDTNGDGLDEQVLLLKNLFERYVSFSEKLPHEMIASFNQVNDPSHLIDLAAAQLTGKVTFKTCQEIIESQDLTQRMEKVVSLLEEEASILENERKLRKKARIFNPENRSAPGESVPGLKFEVPQGEEDEFAQEAKELENKINSVQLSDEAREKALRELKRLKQMSPMSAEATVSRSYIDWILSIPWNEYSPDLYNITQSKQILDDDHYGMDRPKERILEHLAVTNLTAETTGQILCLAGPPGVGKTSLGASLAKACNRSFVRISLGGVKDESEIRGHRRTYVGSMPGKIIQAMRKARTCNPVILLDEIDKMASDIKGDPASAMLEVLDPHQNRTFVDHYMDIDYDLSSVMFIATANSLETIPWALRDRMEIIELDAYTEWDKLAIATRHLIPLQLKKNGLEGRNISFSEAGLKNLIQHYTKEAGVRNLERQIGSVFRKIALEIVSGKTQKKNIKISPKMVENWLGARRYDYGRSEGSSMIGVVNGLGVTSMGGDLLIAEAAVIPGKGRLVLTGKLGEVMQESAQAGLSWVRSQMEKLQLSVEFFESIDIHIHFPEGAVPKDGPSAGVTIITGMISSILKVPVRSEVAMTGEITLRGRVLKIGGLKEKIIAAHRSGMKTVIIPEENSGDLENVPEKVLNAMEIIKVSHVSNVLKHALDWVDIHSVPDFGR